MIPSLAGASQHGLAETTGLIFNGNATHLAAMASENPEATGSAWGDVAALRLQLEPPKQALDALVGPDSPHWSQ